MKIRAIIFEDDIFFLDLLHEFLKMRGYEVLAFPEPFYCPLYEGKEPCCSGEDVCADIIVSDLRMPKIGGIELVEKLHKNGCKVTKIALMSGDWSKEDRKKAEDLQCKIFAKPFDIDILYAWLDECEKKINPNRKLLTILK